MNRVIRKALGGVAALLLVLPGAAVAQPDEPTDPPSSGPRVIAADGTVRGIDAIDPGNRSAGLMALYTPDFGASTATNQFGAEAVLEPSEEGANRWLVTDVCTVWGAQAGDCDAPGDNPIPSDGYVLSASPGGDDPRTFLRDHVAVGDVVTLDLPVLREATTTLDATDPTPQTNPEGVDPASGRCFPGCRGAEQLIRYTPAFGASTGTNQFGYEVIVVDGRVVERGGSDNRIPQDGSVLSGHGARGNWLATNAVVGARVEIDGDDLRVVVDAGAYVFGAERAIARAEDGLAVGTDACLAIDEDTARTELHDARKRLAAARAAIEDGDDLAAVELAEDAERAADRGWHATVTSRDLETRGIWVRPEQESPAEIRATLDELDEAGFTTVYLETFFQGYTIFPSVVAEEHGIEAQRPQFAHFDPMQVWVDEAHARGLELHAWVHSFFVGHDAVGGSGPILREYPEWANVERGAVDAGEPRPSTAEAGYYFVDPSLPDARAYLHGLFDEIVTSYDVDGLHLDYIRYPISLPVEVSFGYTDHARARFEAAYGLDPLALEPDDAAWADWDAWRQAQVSSFVAETHERLADTGRDVVLSAAVFPDRFDAERRKLQNWADWSQDGTIDVLAGMSFGGSPTRSAADTTTMLEATSDATLVVTGTYAPFSSLPPDTMLEQIEAVRAAGAHGVALFAYNQLTTGQAAALASGAFRDAATSTDHEPVTSTAVGLRALSERAEGVHGSCVDHGTRRAFLQRLAQVVDDLERAHGAATTGSALHRAEQRLDRLHAWLDGRIDAEPLATQLDEELERARATLRYARGR